MIELLVYFKNALRIFGKKMVWAQIKHMFLNMIKFFLNKESFPYVLEEIDMKSHVVIIRCRGTRTVIKQRIESLISDMVTIKGLSPKQACLLGGYYGRALRAAMEGRDALKKAKSMSFLLSNNHGHYKVLYQNRDGGIGYINQKTSREFVEHPLVIATSEHIISEFDSSQACYIGILAGISMEKAISMDEKLGTHKFEELLNKRPKLRIIK